MATRRKDYFKHGWDAHLDTKMKLLIEKGGTTYYGSWWIIVELIAKDAWDNKSNCSGELTKKTLRDSLCIRSWTTVEQLLNYCSTIGVLSFNSNEQLIEITIPNLPKYLGKSGSNDPKRKSFDHIVRDKSKEIRDKSKEETIVPETSPPKKKKQSKPNENCDTPEIRKDILETFYGKAFTTFPVGALKQIFKAIDTWEEESSYTDIDLFEMVISYDEYWVELETSGEPTTFKRSKNLATFLKKEDLFKYLCSGTNSAGVSTVSETEVLKEDSAKFKKYEQAKREEKAREQSDSYLSK